MPKHTAFTLALAKRNARPVTKGYTGAEQHNIDPYQLANDRKVRPGQPDARSERTPQQVGFTGAPERTRGVLAKDWQDVASRKAGRQDRWGEQVVARHDPASPKPATVRSSEIRKPIVRATTGAKLKGDQAKASDRTAETLRGNVTRNRQRYIDSYAGAVRS